MIVIPVMPVTTHGSILHSRQTAYNVIAQTAGMERRRIRTSSFRERTGHWIATSVIAAAIPASMQVQTKMTVIHAIIRNTGVSTRITLQTAYDVTQSIHGMVLKKVRTKRTINKGVKR
jgi:hypothetical protein